MSKRAWYLLPLAVAVMVGFAFGHYRQRLKSNEAHRVLYYVDPMHPAYRSAKPGIAPDCGMVLVPVYAEDAGKSLLPAEDSTSQAIKIDPATQQVYGIQLAKVKQDSGQGVVRVFGRVAADETRTFRLNVGTEGFVKETHDDAVGNHVTKDQRLATVYAPEFLSVAGGYLSANEHSPGPGKENFTSTQGAASVQARADRLRNLGMSDVQIDEITRNHKIPEDIYIVSPTDGIIVSRSISSGLRFDRTMELYKIADLHRVWILAEVFGKDAQQFRPGTMATVTLPDTGETFHAQVSDVLPEVDPATRTLKPRLEADNPGFKLRPDMFVNIELPVSRPPGLTVPTDAVLDSGMTKRVFVQVSEGHFEPREVETGWRLDDRVQIVKGLKEGETVVSTGTFLVDSESRLQMTARAGTSSGDAAKPMPAADRHMN